MALAVSIMALALQPLHLSSFLPGLPLDSLFSTQGIMVMLLAAYAGAMWMFLTSAPKVHTIMVSDLGQARQFYEGMLDLPVAEVPCTTTTIMSKPWGQPVLIRYICRRMSGGRLALKRWVLRKVCGIS
jgi:hypothetical protein